MIDNIVVFADHAIGYNIVEYLLNSQANSNFKIIRIFTNINQNAWWKSIAENNLAQPLLAYYEAEKTPTDLLDLEIDYLLLLSWKHIIPDFLIAHVKQKTLNLHYSQLPSHRGVYPVNWAIISGDRYAGVTYHLVNKEIDAGPIIGQDKIEIFWTDDAALLLQKLDQIAFNLFIKIWNKRGNWNASMTKQEGQHSYHSRSEYLQGNIVELETMMKVKDFINLARGKTFNNYSSLFFIDPVSQKKYSVQLTIKEIENE